MKLAWCLPLLLIAGFVGCSDSSGDGDDDDDDDGNGTGTGTGTNTDKCYDVSVNTTAGGEACGDVSCPAGEYCEFAGSSDCQVGCIVESTCPTNQYCDLSGAPSGGAGTCRTPGAEHEVPCTGTNTGTGTGTGATCLEICDAKLDLCGGGPPGVCEDVCTVATPTQQDCLQAAMCEDFADGEECGLSFTGPEGGGSQGGD